MQDAGKGVGGRKQEEEEERQDPGRTDVSTGRRRVSACWVGWSGLSARGRVWGPPGRSGSGGCAQPVATCPRIYSLVPGRDSSRR